MIRISPLPTVPFHPRLTKAECEFWFEAGADWQEQTEQRIEAQLARAFPDAFDASEPFLWFEPNYLAILNGPTTDSKGYTDVEAHSGCIMRALDAYQDAAHPRRVQTLFLNYQFEFDAGILPPGPMKQVWDTPRAMMTLEREVPQGRSRGGPQTRLALRCLVTHPPISCLARSRCWLERIHRRMDGAFQDLQQGASFGLDRH